MDVITSVFLKAVGQSNFHGSDTIVHFDRHSELELFTFNASATFRLDLGRSSLTAGRAAAPSAASDRAI